MALHHPRAALLALSTLLGIIGFLHASDTPLIPLDQLTVEEAFLEHYLVIQQLRSANPPNMTAEQKAIFDRLYYNTDFVFFKPNDPLPSSLHQKMSKFRQAFSNWDQPLKPGTIEYLLTRASGQMYLYKIMKQNVYEAVKNGNHRGNMVAVYRASSAFSTLAYVYSQVKKKYNNSSSLVKPEDVKKLEVAIKMARDTVMALPRINKNGELVSGTSLSSKQTTSSTLLLPKKSANEKPDGPVESSGEFSSAEQVEDSAGDDGDSVEPDEVPPRPGSPIVSSGVDPAGPDEQLPSGSAGSMPGGWSSPSPCKSRNNLFYLLKRPYVWGTGLVLAAGAGYYFLRGHPASSTLGDLCSMSTSTLNFAFVASEGSSPFWYILFLIGGLVALVALGYGCWYWCYNKTDGEAPREEKTKASKRTSKKKSRRNSPTTTGTPSSAKTTTARS